MIDDREIWACAHHLLQHRGADARAHAESRAAELGAARDEEGRRTWLRILARIEQLEAPVLTGETH